jgi:hypothetical protein
VIILSARVGTLKLVVDNNGTNEFADVYPKTSAENVEGIGTAISAALPGQIGNTIQQALTANVIIQTAAQFTTANPTLLAGQFGLESDTNLLKIGNGSTAWASLPYINAPLQVQNGNNVTQSNIVLETVTEEEEEEEETT